MLFSVLIPVYNVEKYLVKCVESVLSQSERDFEILLVDDGSTDSSGRICDEYAEKYGDVIRVIHKDNEGLLLTRRRAIREARGEYFVHLDSDDYMLPDALRSIRRAIEENDADMVVCNIVYGQSDISDMSVVSRPPFKDGDLFEGERIRILRDEFLNGGSITSVCQKITRRDIVDVNATYPDCVSIAEDYMQSFPLLNNAKRLVYLDKAIIYYRYNEASMTKAKTYKSYERAFWSKYTVFKEIDRYIDVWKSVDSDRDAIRIKHIRSLLRTVHNMVCAYDKRAGDDIDAFLDTLSKEEFWKKLSSVAQRNDIGKVSSIRLQLINKKRPTMLRLLSTVEKIV